MRTDQGIERADAEAAVTQAQTALDALPEQQRAALARLDANHQADLILARARVRSARGQADEAAQAREREAGQIAATATAITGAHQATATALIGAHQAAVSATARAIPTPAPSAIISHADGKIVAITAEEKDGRLLVTIELTTTR